MCTIRTAMPGRPTSNTSPATGTAPKRVVLLGMNPGPFGMMQTGVPFGEVAAVRDWMGIRACGTKAGRRACRSADPRLRLPALGGQRTATVGMGGAPLRHGRTLLRRLVRAELLPAGAARGVRPQLHAGQTPASLLARIYAACDRHLAVALRVLTPEWAIGIGGFAEKRIRAVLEGNLVDSALARKCASAASCTLARPARRPTAAGRKRPRSSSPSRCSGLRLRAASLAPQPTGQTPRSFRPHSADNR